MSTGNARSRQAGGSAVAPANGSLANLAGSQAVGGAAVLQASDQQQLRVSGLSDRNTIIQPYERKLQKARRWARLLGSLKTFSHFLAFCNLTWATVALLGAFLPSLYTCDFAFVTSLVFVEAFRLASVAFFMRLLIRPLFYGSKDPSRIQHDTDGQYPLSLRARCCSNVMQLIFIIPSLAIPVIGLVLHDYSSSATRNLSMSLQIFYYLVTINSVVALVYLLCSLRAFVTLNDGKEQSILRYFDTVLERATDWGIVQADDFDFFRFAYTTLGNDFRRNVQPEAVAKNHKQLIQYLYAHALGMDALEIYLDANDPFVRLAAANIVGFWADTNWGVGVGEPLKVPEEILTKLADKVSLGEVGWAVANCFGALALTSTGARLVASTFTSKNGSIVHRLAYVVDHTRSRSLSPVRSLVRVYEQWWKENEQDVQLQQHPSRPLGDQEQEKLAVKLRKLAGEAKVGRLRVQAAYLLLLMMEEEPGQKLVGEIDPRKDKFWSTSERTMLEVLRRRHLDLPPLELPQAPNFFRADASLRPPRWVIPPI